MSAYFIPPFSCNPFLTLLSRLFTFFFITRINFKAFRSHEIKVHMGDLVQSIDTAFINSVIQYIIMLWFKFNSGSNFFKPVYSFQTGSYFLN